MTVTINGTNGVTTPEVTLDNSSADGGQVVLKSSGYSNWNLDNYNGRLRAYYGSTEYFTVDSSGNLGIGTSSPNQVLSLKRSAAVGAYIDMAGNNNTLGTNSFLIGQGEDNQAYIYNRYNSNMHFAVNNVEQMTLMAGGDLRFNSGYGSVATAYGCRAWVNFNGTGTVAIRASGNVSSITDNGVGDYTVNFTNAMPDANYSASGMGAALSTGGCITVGFGTPYAAPATTNVRVFCQADNGALYDTSYVCVSIHR